MTIAISASGDGIVILSVEYAANGLDWARIYDNYCVGWLVDENLAVPYKPDTTGRHAPFPLIIGTLPVPAPDTAPIISPQWGKYVRGEVFIPDLWRGSLSEFLTGLATNNGARRLLGSRLAAAPEVAKAFHDWGRANPGLLLPDDAIPSARGFGF
jgi:hypothetical protein